VNEQTEKEENSVCWQESRQQSR
jgi:hypothetical protein